MHHQFIDKYARGDSVMHRLDPRIKLLAVLVYTGLLVSIDKYQVTRLIPFAVLPLGWIMLGGIPGKFVFKQVLLCSPFVAALVIFNPLFDRTSHQVVTPWGLWTVGGGVLVAANLLLKYLWGITALVALTSTTRFDELLIGMRKLGVPKLFVGQLSFLYRYLFELIEQGQRLRRARQARLVGRGSVKLRVRSAAGMVAMLFVRTLESAQRIHQAMLARLYDGQIRTGGDLRFGRNDLAFSLLVAVYCVVCKL